MRSSTPFDGFSQVACRPSFPYAALFLRLALGILFFMAGWSKLTVSGGWSAGAYLERATGPFASFFQSMAGSPVVDLFNVWGLTLIGLALILGLGVRLVSFLGAVLMILYYFSVFVGNTAHGFIDEHIIYVFVLALFMAGGFGHVWGLDAIVERKIGRAIWLRYLLG